MNHSKQLTKRWLIPLFISLLLCTHVFASSNYLGYTSLGHSFDVTTIGYIPMIDYEIELEMDWSIDMDRKKHNTVERTVLLNSTESIAAGSWVIPLDQDLKAYGFAVHLLHADIPVKWAINATKIKDGTDFSANVTKFGSINTEVLEVKGSAIIVPKEFVANAELILNALFISTVEVYVLGQQELIDIKYTLTHKPKAAVIENDKSEIHTKIFEAAGLTEGVHYIDDIAAKDLSDLQCITFACEPHDEDVEELEVQNVKKFVQSGGNFFGQCAALQGYEGTNKNDTNKFDTRLLTNAGLKDPGKSGTIIYNDNNASDAIMQFIGNLANEGGSAEAIKEFDNGIQTGATAKGYAPFNQGDKYKVYGGRIGGTSEIRGYTHYLAGHKYEGSNTEKLNGQRILLNALLMPAIRPESCGLQVVDVICPNPIENLCVAPDFNFANAFSEWKNSFENTGGCDIVTNINDLNSDDYIPGADYEKTFTYAVTSTCDGPSGIPIVTVKECTSSFKVTTKPMIIATSPVCANDNNTYSVTVSVSSGIVLSSYQNAVVKSNGNNTWSISDIPAGVDTTLTVTNDDNSCDNSVLINGLNCIAPAINLSKSGEEICVDNTVQIRYTFTVKNTGNTALSNVAITDPLLDNASPVIQLSGPNGDTNSNGVLESNETWVYFADYPVLNSGIIDNTATVKAQSGSQIIGIGTSATYTSIKAGSWDDNSTWLDGIAPPRELQTGAVVNILHRVKVISGSDIEVKNNAQINVNSILLIPDGNLKIYDSNSIVNIINGVIIICDNNIENENGTINFSNGGIQLGNGNFLNDKDSGSSNGMVNGNGYIWSYNGNIKNENDGVFSAEIVWCIEDGNGEGLPTTENCVLLDAISGCDDETFYNRFLHVMDMDTASVDILLPEISCPENQELCINADVIILDSLNGEAPEGGVFSGDGVSNGVFDPSQAGLGTHEIMYTYTSNMDCSFTCIFEIVVLEIPNAPDTESITYCVGDIAMAITDAVTGSGELKWYSDAEATQEISQPEINTEVANTNTYYVTQTDDNTCESAPAIIQIVVNGLPVAAASVSGPITCDIPLVGLTATSTSENVSYAWTGPNDFTSSAQNLEVSLDGIYVLTVKDNDTNCLSTDTVTVIENFEKPSPDETKATICEGDEYPWNGDIYTIAGTYTIPSDTICEADKKLILVVTETPTIAINTAASCTADLLQYTVSVDVSTGATVTSTSGAVVHSSGDTWEITVDAGTDITLTSTAPSGGCTTTLPVTAPDCSCPVVIAPVSGGDELACNTGQTLLASATADPGDEVNWYESTTGGVALSTSPELTGVGTVTYYAEARNTTTNCVSATRTGVTLTLTETPTIAINTAASCTADLLQYTVSVDVSTGATVTSTSGAVVHSSGDTWEITVDAGTDITLTSTAPSGGCTTTLLVTAPDCSCPVVIAPVSGGDELACNTGQTLLASATADPGDEVNWYESTTGGVALSTNPELTGVGTVTYYAEARNTTTNCVSATRTGVTLTLTETPTIAINTAASCTADLLQYTVSVDVSTGATVTSTSGAVVHSSGDTWEITVDAGTDITLTSTAPSGGCTTTLPITAPDCSCPVVIAPVSGGDELACNTGQTLLASATIGSGEVIDWYSTATGGVALSTNPELTGVGTVTYYAEARNTTTNCVSATRTGVTLTLTETPTIAINTAASCTADLLQYTVSVDVSTGATVTSTSGAVVNSSGDTWEITVDAGTDITLTSTAPSGGCTTTLPVTAPDCSCPVVIAPVSGGDELACNTGQTLLATATIGSGEVIDWYSTATGGVALSTSPELTGVGTVTYYAEARNTTTNCVSATRTGVTLTLTETPTIAINTAASCTADLLQYTVSVDVSTGATVTSTSGAVVNSSGDTWEITVDAGTDITLTSTAPSGGCTTTLPVTAPDCSCPVVIAPVSGGDELACNTGQTLLASATADPGDEVNWYESATGGVALSTSPELTGVGTVTYYAEARNTTTNCVSATRTGVTLTLTETPTIAINTAASCTADLLQYTVSVDVSTGATVTSTSGAVVNSSGDTWEITVDAGTDITLTSTAPSGGCTTTLPITAPDCSCPVVIAPVSGGDELACNTGQTLLASATADPGDEVNWYESATGGVALSTSPELTGVGTVTYYAEARNTTTNCVSATRTGVTLTLTETPTIAINTAASCTADLLQYTVSVDVSTGATVTSTSGAVVHSSGDTWEITVDAGTDITLTSTAPSGGCTTTLPITAPDCSCPVVIAPVSGGDELACNTGQTLLASATADPGDEVNWYESATGGVALSTSPELTGVGTVTYYAEARNTTTNCVSATRTGVRLEIYALPNAPGTESITYCVGDTAMAITDAVTGSGELKWYSDVEATQAISQPEINTEVANTNTYYVTQTDDNTCESAPAIIQVMINPNPFIKILSKRCDANNLNYNITFESNGTIESSLGTVDNNNNTITGIPSGENIIVTSTLNECSTELLVEAELCQDIEVTANGICINNAAYLKYAVDTVNLPGATSVTITWKDNQGAVIQTDENQPLTGEILWAGMLIENGENSDWPGWILEDGIWSLGADGFEDLRPSADIMFTVNTNSQNRVAGPNVNRSDDSIFETEVNVGYPPGTPECSPNPPENDPCTDYEEVAENGLVYGASNAGSAHSIWINGFPCDGIQTRFTFDDINKGYFYVVDDSNSPYDTYARIIGEARVTQGGSCDDQGTNYADTVWQVDAYFRPAQLNEVDPKGGSNYDTSQWRYWVIDSGQMTNQSNTQEYVKFFDMPNNNYGLQLGIGANDKNDEFGASTWLHYEIKLDGQEPYSSSDTGKHLDFNLNLEDACPPVVDQCEEYAAFYSHNGKKNSSSVIYGVDFNNTNANFTELLDLGALYGAGYRVHISYDAELKILYAAKNNGSEILVITYNGIEWNVTGVLDLKGVSRGIVQNVFYKDMIYLGSSKSNKIFAVDPVLKTVTPYKFDGLNINGGDLVVDRNGLFYSANRKKRKIFQLDFDTMTASRINGGANTPRKVNGIAVSENGNNFIMTNHRSKKVSVLDDTGNVIGEYKVNSNLKNNKLLDGDLASGCSDFSSNNDPVDCDNYKAYYADHDGGDTSLYEVSLNGTNANFSMINTLPFRAHITLNTADGYIYAVNENEQNLYKVDPNSGTIINEIGLNSTDGTTINSIYGVAYKNGMIYLSSDKKNAIYQVDPNTGNFERIADEVPVEGGDITFIGNELYLATRAENKIYSVINGTAQIFQPFSIEAKVNGLALNENSEFITTNYGDNVLYRYAKNGTALAPYAISGDIQEFRNGDLASGCITSSPEPLCQVDNVTNPGAEVNGLGTSNSWTQYTNATKPAGWDWMSTSYMEVQRSEVIDNNSSANGDFHFELLAKQQGDNIYQVIDTKPGSTIYINFYHKKRKNDDKSDIMEVRTGNAIGWDNTSNSLTAIGSQEVRSNYAEGWIPVCRSYEVPEGQTQTVIMLIGLSGSSSSVGNLIDDVYVGCDPQEGFECNTNTASDEPAARIDSSINIKIEDSNVDIYPVPASTRLSIKLSNGDEKINGMYYITNVTGLKVGQHKINISAGDIMHEDISLLQDGVYFLVVEINGTRIMKQFVKVSK